MVDPATAAMIAKAGIAAIQYISGAVGAKNAKRPMMTMPQSMVDALSILQRRAGESRLPGQDAFEAEVDQDVANNMARAMTVANGPSASNYITTLNAGGLEAKRKIAAEAAAYQDQNQLRLVQQKKDMAAIENQIFNINQLAPYLDAMKANSAKMGAGLTNLMGTIDSAVLYGQSQDYLDEATFAANGRSRGIKIDEMGYQGLPEGGVDYTGAPPASMATRGVPEGGVGYGTPLVTPMATRGTTGFSNPVPDSLGTPQFLNENLNQFLQYAKYFNIPSVN